MRRIITTAVVAIAAGAWSAAASAQTVSFQFAAPTKAMLSNFPAADVQDGQADGYRSIRITPARLPIIRKMVPQNSKMMLTFDALQPGTPLRARVDRMLAISNKGVGNVQVWLVDDTTGIPVTAGYAKRPFGGRLHVWPAGGNFLPDKATQREGLIAVGEVFAGVHEKATLIGWNGWLGIILHEFLHTQWMEPRTKWGVVNISYGLDNNHDWSEILGAQDTAFEEGLGNFFRAEHNFPQDMVNANGFFSKATTRYMFEDGSIPASWMDLRKAADSSKEIPIPAPVAAAQPGRKTYTRYCATWLKVPGKYLLFNEYTTTGFHLYFWQHANGDAAQALQMIFEMATEMRESYRTRKLSYAANHLALQLEAFAATPAGKTKQAAGTLTSSMFPLALVDLLTHFGMTEADYQLEFKRDQPPARALAQQEYWKHRDAVKKLVESDLKASPIRFPLAVASIHKYFQQANTILVKP
jgi:hypothetical protein